MPHFPSYNFFGTPVPNFAVNNDRILDNLRVRQPNTFKAPPASKILIDPNVGMVGDNNPATNDTLRSGVAQAGALVYATEPIINSAGPGNPPVDGCFDGRNHLYFSDGDQWIPLANCLPKNGKCAGPQYAEIYMANNNVTTNLTPNVWAVVQGDKEKGLKQGCFAEWPVGPATQIQYTGEDDVDVRVSLAVSWLLDVDGGNPKNTCRVGVFLNNKDDPEDNLIGEGELGREDRKFPRNVSLTGLLKLSKNDFLRVKVLNEEGDVQANPILVTYMTLNVQKGASQVGFLSLPERKFNFRFGFFQELFF